MRLPRVRWTVRNLMIFVLILGGGNNSSGHYRKL